LGHEYEVASALAREAIVREIRGVAIAGGGDPDRRCGRSSAACAPRRQPADGHHVVAAKVSGQSLREVAWVGDSRVYLARWRADPDLQDHSYV
jgi:serine/threonine protein phosphatase PrpC